MGDGSWEKMKISKSFQFFFENCIIVFKRKKIPPNFRRKSQHARFCHDTSSSVDVYNKMGRYVWLKGINVRLSGIIEQMGVLTTELNIYLWKEQFVN